MRCLSLFKALKLPPGRTTVMHLVARETLPEPNSHGEDLFLSFPLQNVVTEQGILLDLSSFMPANSQVVTKGDSFENMEELRLAARPNKS